MSEQLAFAIPADEAEVTPAEEVDLADSVLKAYGGDARAAIRELLLDADFLRDQLYTASCIMSAGMSRGWKPRYERVR